MESQKRNARTVIEH